MGRESIGRSSAQWPRHRSTSISVTTHSERISGTVSVRYMSDKNHYNMSVALRKHRKAFGRELVDEVVLGFELNYVYDCIYR